MDTSAAMQAGTEKILAKAFAAVAAARRNAARGALDAAAARAYYAMLYAARALLNERGTRVRAHAEVSAALRRAETLRRDFGDLADRFDDALRRRRAADDAGAPTAGEVGDWIERASAFATGAARYIDAGNGDRGGDDRVRGDESNSRQ